MSVSIVNILAQLVARIVEDGGELGVRDVTAGAELRRTRFEVDDDIRHAVHAAESLRDVLDAVGAGHALDVNGLFHGKIFLSLCGGSVRRFFMYVIHRGCDGAYRYLMARVLRFRRRLVHDGEQAQTQGVQHDADARQAHRRPA